MKTYEVEITRNSWATQTFTVAAETVEEAAKLALQQAASTVFDEDDAAYVIDDVSSID